jgi:hexokinase
MDKTPGQAFIEKYGLSPQAIDLEGTVEAFIDEMERGLDGRESSLPMIPAYIDPGAAQPVSEEVIAIDAGGTNLRISSVGFDAGGKPSVESFNIYPMPGTQGEIGIHEFFDQLAAHIAPAAKGREKIGLCFSFPATITPGKDGRIIMFDKEVRVKDAGSALLGENLLKALGRRGISHIKKVVVINDTVATALGAQAQLASRQYGGFIGFILGTGTNTCYAEQNRNIGKIPDLAETAGSMLINVESGSFGKAMRGPIDIRLDSASHDPGKMQLEKMISGAYIGEIFRLCAITAQSEGILRGEFIRTAEKAGTAWTRELSAFLDNPFKGLWAQACTGDHDRKVLWETAGAIVSRAAKLAAAMVIASSIKCGAGRDPLRPIFVSAEGTTLYRLKGLHDGIKAHLGQYCDKREDLFIEMGQVDNTTIFGSAIAALT